MKKVMLLVVCGFMVLGFTGCAGKKVKCTMEDETAKSSLIGTFKDEKLVKYEMESTATFEDEEELESGYEMAQFSVGMVNTIEGVEGDVSKKGNSVTLKVTADLSKMSAEDIEDMLDTESMTVEEFKAYATEEGYTCK